MSFSSLLLLPCMTDPSSDFPLLFLSLHSTFFPILYFLHLQMSFVVRIVPSPDWFVGVDKVDLCDGDHWKDSVTLELFPYDAGTDSGFTFSSPNFETIPQDKITQVSQQQNCINPKWRSRTVWAQPHFHKYYKWWSSQKKLTVYHCILYVLHKLTVNILFWWSSQVIIAVVEGFYVIHV